MTDEALSRDDQVTDGELACQTGDPVSVWPCANCGRPVPQAPGAARTIRYCQDNDDACAREAQGRRERGKDTPGLTGQVAWAWEMVERMEKMADAIACSMVSELSVAGVERRVAEAHAEAARYVAAAQEERDASQRQAEGAWREAAAARSRAIASEQDAELAREEAEEAIAERAAANSAYLEAKQAAAENAAARMAAERERDHFIGRESELLAALEAARSELVNVHSRLAEAETAAEGQRFEAAADRRAAEDLRAAVRDAEAYRGRAVADRDQMQAKLQDYERQTWQLSQTVSEQQAALTALVDERDAARAEADRARRQIDAYTRTSLTDVGRPGRGHGDRPTHIDDSPAGLHSLNGFRRTL